MNRRSAILVTLLVLMVAMIGVQLWLIEQQSALRAQRQAEYHQAMARWYDMPRGPGTIRPPQPIYHDPPAQPPILLWQTPLMVALAAAAAAHEQKKRKEREAEEEARTTYPEEDLMTDWEFKIVRSPVGLFDRPEFLARVLGEEEKGGWRLVEKFDGFRVRLKRPGGSLPGSATLPAAYDPFRTTVGPQSRSHPVLWVLSVCCWLAAVAMAVLMLAKPGVTMNGAIVGGIAVVGGLLLAWLASRQQGKYRRLAG